MGVPVVGLRGIVLNELQALAVCLVHTAHHLGGVAAIGGSFHNGQALQRCLEAHGDIGLDACGHILSAFGRDQHHARRSLGTPKGRAIPQDFHALDICGIEQRKRIGTVAIKAGFGLLLHLPDDTVDNEEGLGREVQRLQPPDEVGGGGSRLSALKRGKEGTLLAVAGQSAEVQQQIGVVEALAEVV